MVFIPLTPDIGDVFVVLLDWALRREGCFGRGEDCDDGAEGGFSGGVEDGELVGGGGGKDVNVGDDLDGFEEVIEGDYGVAKHEERFGNVEWVLQVPCSSGLEVFYAVVGDVTEGAAGHGRESEPGEF